jgi:hypothetical protein
MQAVLVMFRADGERRSFSLPREMTVVGRREDCDLRIPLGDVSRKHCRLVKEGDTLRIEDLGSSNGTYHNGQRVQEAVINAGDTIQIGPVVFVAQIDGHPADDELQPFTTQAAAALTASAAGADLVEAATLEEVESEPTVQSDELVEAEELDELEEVGQEQTITGGDSGAGNGHGFDPMEVLQSDEESDASDLVDFDIVEEAEEAADDVQVQISFDDAGNNPRPGERA